MFLKQEAKVRDRRMKRYIKYLFLGKTRLFRCINIHYCLAESFTFILGLKDFFNEETTHYTYKPFQIYIEDYLT